MANERFCSGAGMALFEERLTHFFIDDELLRHDIGQDGEIIVDAI
jgi:hypothetical protein